MTNASKYEFEFPDEAGYPDGTGTLSQTQKSLIDEVTDADDERPKSELAFEVVRDDDNKRYDALVEDEAVGIMTYELNDTRISLVSTEVPPDYRGQGVASELIWRVLDDIRKRGETVTVICPIVRTFINEHPEYSDLVDTVRPGLKSR
jgi:predicted GNAT family acetyltransferase